MNKPDEENEKRGEKRDLATHGRRPGDFGLYVTVRQWRDGVRRCQQPRHLIADFAIAGVKDYPCGSEQRLEAFF